MSTCHQIVTLLRISAPLHQNGGSPCHCHGKDPLSLIIAALDAGAAAAAKDTASAAIQDAYQGLKVLIQQKVAGDAAATVVLEEHEKDPYTFDAPLKKKLVEAAADQDGAILQAARALLDQTAPPAASGPVITQTIRNVMYAATSATGDATIGSIHDHRAGTDA